MNMRLLILLVLCCCATATLVAQTRKVRHRSHSGSPAAFEAFLEEDKLGMYDPSKMQVEYNVALWVDSLRRKYPNSAAAQDSSFDPLEVQPSRIWQMIEPTLQNFDSLAVPSAPQGQVLPEGEPESNAPSPSMQQQSAAIPLENIPHEEQPHALIFWICAFAPAGLFGVAAFAFRRKAA